MKKTIHEYFCDLCESKIDEAIRVEFDSNLTFNNFKNKRRVQITIKHLCVNCESKILSTIEELKTNKNDN
jgi:uncharacterized protein YlaI